MPFRTNCRYGCTVRYPSTLLLPSTERKRPAPARVSRSRDDTSTKACSTPLAASALETSTSASPAVALISRPSLISSSPAHCSLFSGESRLALGHPLRIVMSKPIGTGMNALPV
eukprot:scaffold3676_cov152-Pinguiococcus_pyrenoidosus.AAC.6